ncbi:SNARE complex subunit [Ophiocordyceps sinensis CO18]|uniref:SNARE complex subunit n=1 Tax=Ophiocordyceps sinensis (strain Co18 / CGMCC 3.14243) TaxID=911162 RepID=T5APZ7_OPHSC|nr:SNARE complex subunit [Ophiocordyceps sinensis CO18]
MAPPPEIAIPSTSVSDEGSSKPFTLYNITLRLPLRSYVVQKRYSEFAKLHNTLVEQVGSPPPEPLPGKHWLKSTVKSADLARGRPSRGQAMSVEERRRRRRGGWHGSRRGWRGGQAGPRQSGDIACHAVGRPPQDARVEPFGRRRTTTAARLGVYGPHGARRAGKTVQ